MIDRKRTKTEKQSYAELDLQLIELKVDLDHLDRKALIPPGWRRVEKEHPVRARKASLTLRLDADLVKWFRAMGHGYQARMNAVLRLYMLAIVSRAIESRGSTDWKGEPI